MQGQTQIANTNIKCAQDKTIKYTDEDKLTYGQRNKGEIHFFLNTGKVVAVTDHVGKLFQTETTV